MNTLKKKGYLDGFTDGYEAYRKHEEQIVRTKRYYAMQFFLGLLIVISTGLLIPVLQWSTIGIGFISIPLGVSLMFSDEKILPERLLTGRRM